MRHHTAFGLLNGLKSSVAVSALMVMGLCAVPNIGLAQETASGEKAANQDVIIVTGTAGRINRDAVLSNISVLTRKDIEAKGPSGLGDMLAYLPGVRSSSFAPGASRPIIRGLEGYRVLVLNNGMGVVDVSALSPDHAVPTNPALASRIEVLRGPSALAYGGNAIGGVVNVIDDVIPNAPANDGLDGSLVLQGSSADKGKQGALALKFGQGSWVLGLDVFSAKTEDYATPVGPLSQALTDSLAEPRDTRKRQTNSATDMKSASMGLAYLGEGGNFGLSAKTIDYTYGLAAEEGVVIAMRKDRYDARGSIVLKSMPFNRLDLSAGYTDYAHSELEDGDVGTQFLATGSEYRMAFVREALDKVSATVGLSLFDRDFEAIGDEAFVPSSKTKSKAIFGQWRYDEGQWGLDAGARLENQDIASPGFSRDFTTSSISAGSFYRFNDHSFVGLSLTRSMRAPSETELLADGNHIATGQYVIGDRDLKAETGTSIEFTGHLLVDVHNPINIDLHLYHSRFSNFIDLLDTGTLTVEDVPIFEYRQTDASLYGLEIDASAKLGKIGSQALKLGLGYDWTIGKSDLGHIGRIPPQAITLSLDAQGNGFDSRLEWRHVTARKDRLAGFETQTNGYDMVNLMTSYQPVNYPKMSIFAELRNITNAEIREATSVTKDRVVGQGRSLRIGLRHRF